ncbi:MAG: type III pantothenate kinase [Desulfobacterales bacterium]|nr:type III pantothenate kinase [Desulfobacterales bacterium]
MLLVIDIGNTNTVLGVFDGSRLIKDWRIRTERDTTEDELYALFSSFFTQAHIDEGTIERTIISCVVPPLMMPMDALCRKYLRHAPMWIDARSASGMPILYNNPSEIGADRIVNAVAAFQKYKVGLIVIDFGTATTFDVISPKGEYLGGVISPGVKIAAEALFQKASKLPRVEMFIPPATVIGKDTNTCIQSGIIYGYAGLVDGIVGRVFEEMTDSQPKVIATGGLAPLMYGVCKTIEVVEPQLALEGLRIIDEKQRNGFQ